MRFGVYYLASMDFDDRPIGNLGSMLDPRGSYPDCAAQVRELIERYRPSVLWNDIAWPAPARTCGRCSPSTTGPCPTAWSTTGGCRGRRSWPRPATTWSPVGPMRSTPAPPAPRAASSRRSHRSTSRPPSTWCSTTSMADTVGSASGAWTSFGYNRMSGPEQFLTDDELLDMAADITSKGGNLRSTSAPRGGDAAIPDEQRARLDTSPGGPDTDRARPVPSVGCAPRRGRRRDRVPGAAAVLGGRPARRRRRPGTARRFAARGRRRGDSDDVGDRRGPESSWSGTHR